MQRNTKERGAITRYSNACLVSPFWKNNQTKIHYLTQVFNSPAGKLYEKISNLKALALLRENYKDKATMRRINQNLKLLGETFRPTSIEKHMKRDYRELNTKARKHLKEIRKA